MPPAKRAADLLSAAFVYGVVIALPPPDSVDDVDSVPLGLTCQDSALLTLWLT